MKKNWLLVAIIGLFAYFFVSADKCFHSSEKVVVNHKDTIYLNEHRVDTVVKRIYTMTVLKDTIRIVRFIEKDTAYIFFADTSSTGFDRDMRIWQGSGLSSNSNCKYDYTIGVLNDTVYFVDMQSDCRQIDTIIQTEITTYIPSKSDLQKNSFYAGLFTSPISKDWYIPGISLTYTRKQNLYFGVDYAPYQGSFFVRAGTRIR